MKNQKGRVLVICAPSGTGKTTLAKRLMDEFPKLNYSVSCTTREPRPGEIHGEDYFFLDKEEFNRRILNDEFIEWAEVHGQFYGTDVHPIERWLKEGNSVLLDIDVQGAAQIRASRHPAIRRATVDLFVMPPSEDELRARLAGRATDSPEVIALRMRNALAEMARWPDYTYRLLSGTREQDYARLRAILTAERLRVSRLAPPSH